jgi:hypothetical protein
LYLNTKNGPLNQISSCVNVLHVEFHLARIIMHTIFNGERTRLELSKEKQENYILSDIIKTTKLLKVERSCWYLGEMSYL